MTTKTINGWKGAGRCRKCWVAGWLGWCEVRLYYGRAGQGKAGQGTANTFLLSYLIKNETCFFFNIPIQTNTVDCLVTFCLTQCKCW